MAVSLSTDDFINTYRRFTGRRGPVRQLRCDRGTNFVGARKELELELNQLKEDDVAVRLRELECDYVRFQLNTPYSSHMGGVWERQIQTVRAFLTALLHEYKGQLDDDLLTTFFIEAEAIVNSRPLTCVDMSSPDALEPITPAMLLTMKPRIAPPPPGSFERADVYSRSRWRRVQFLAEEFWKQWRREFLPTLQERRKWTHAQRNVSVGDVVLMVDEQVPRVEWPLARVTDRRVGEDGLVRTVTVKTKDGVYERPIHKLVVLVTKDPRLGAK